MIKGYNMLTYDHIEQIKGMTDTELKSFKNILCFNLRGILVGDRAKVLEKLCVVEKVLQERENDYTE
jgi:hypothetical protein